MTTVQGIGLGKAPDEYCHRGPGARNLHRRPQLSLPGLRPRRAQFCFTEARDFQHEKIGESRWCGERPIDAGLSMKERAMR
jgi:hypothetical protein